MKKIIYYITIISVAFLAYACDEIDTPVLDQGDKPNATFTASIQKISITDNDNGQFVVELERGNAAQAADIPIALTTDESVPEEINFRLASNTAKFAHGEYTTTITIECDTEEMEYYQEYRVNLQITDANKGPLYPTGFTTTKLDVKRDLVYIKIGTGTFKTRLFGEEWEQDVYRADVPGVQRFRLPNLYYRNYHMDFYMNEDLTEIIEWPTVATGYSDATYGMYYFYFRPEAVTYNGNTIVMGPYFCYINSTGGLTARYAEEATLVLPAEFFQQ